MLSMAYEANPDGDDPDWDIERHDREQKEFATTVAVSCGGCKRCGCRACAPLDDLCASCREKVGGTPNCYTKI